MGAVNAALAHAYGDGVLGQLIHVVLQMVGQVSIRHRGLAVHAVDQLQQVAALDEDALKPLDGVRCV